MLQIYTDNDQFIHGLLERCPSGMLRHMCIYINKACTIFWILHAKACPLLNNFYFSKPSMCTCDIFLTTCSVSDSNTINQARIIVWWIWKLKLIWCFVYSELLTMPCFSCDDSKCAVVISEISNHISLKVSALYEQCDLIFHTPGSDDSNHDRSGNIWWLVCRDERMG